MRWRSSLVVLSIVLLIGCSRPSGKLQPSPSSNTESPLELSVYLPSGPDDLKPVASWLPSDSLKTKIYAIVRIKNVSDQPVVLPNFSYWNPGCTFTSAAWNARKPRFFRALVGQLDSVLLKPGQSIYGVDNIASQITFLSTGSFDVEYHVDVGYSPYRGGGETEADLMKSYATAEHHQIAQGKFEVPITTDQVSSL